MSRKDTGFQVASDDKSAREYHHPCVLNSFGRVCIAGLGIGYVVQKISKKPDISSIIIIEKDIEIIELIYPMIKTPKTEVVCADFFDYLNDCSTWNIDYTWVDIYNIVSYGIYWGCVVPIKGKIKKLNSKAVVQFQSEREMVEKFSKNSTQT